MVNYDPKEWLKIAIAYQSTVLPRVQGRMAVLAGLTFIFWLLNRWLEFTVVDPVAYTILGVAVGLLIVFRNNCSYDRYWEGRKLWGSIVNSSRNLVRGAVSYAGDGKPLARLVSAYALALKQHLRSSKDLEEIREIVTPDVYEQACKAANPPSIIALHMSKWIQAQLKAGRIDGDQCRMLESYVATFLDCQGGCERILRTPIPFAYAVHIKQLLLLYLLSLPYVLVIKMGWLAIPAVAVIAFGLLGIEEAGVEIEDPFGDDPNDLPVESICAVVVRDATALAELGDA